MWHLKFITLCTVAAWAPCVSGDFAIRTVERVVTGPTLADPFRHPMGLAVDAGRGILAIGDTGNHRLVLFDSMGRSRGAITWASNGKIGAGEPKCVALDGRGRLFVLDAVAGQIEVVSASGSRLGFLQPQLPPGVDGLVRPQFVSVGASGRIYVLYAGERAGIAVIEPNGTTSRCIGFEAPEEARLQAPLSLAVDSSETRIVVLDPPALQQVKVFDPEGVLLLAFGEHGEGDGTFSLAAHVVWGQGDTLWILDTIRHSIGIHAAADGRYLGRIGGFGRGAGQFNYPTACAFLAANRFVVLERAGARFQIFELEPVETSGLGSELERSGSGNSGVEESVPGGR